MYNGFFGTNSKSSDSAGYHNKVNRNSTQFKYTANQIHFRFPADKLIDGFDELQRKSDTAEDVISDEESMAELSSTSNTENALLQDLMVFMGVLAQCESVFRATLNEQSEQFWRIVQQQEDQLAAEASAAEELNAEAAALHDMVEEQKKMQMKEK